VWPPRLWWWILTRGLLSQCREAVIYSIMMVDPAHLPDDVATLKAMLIAANVRTLDLDAQIAN
jgi:hypothetical protein